VRRRKIFLKDGDEKDEDFSKLVSQIIFKTEIENLLFSTLKFHAKSPP